MNEIYEGICGSHTGGRMLAHKAIRMGYFLPGMHAESIEMVRRCKKCQLFAPVPNIPPEELTPISSPWPFAQWGVDIVGLLLTGKGKVKFAVMVINYFTKWAEEETLTRITT
jgi:hypothetical protein